MTTLPKLCPFIFNCGVLKNLKRTKLYAPHELVTSDHCLFGSRVLLNGSCDLVSRIVSHFFGVKGVNVIICTYHLITYACIGGMQDFSHQQ